MKNLIPLLLMLFVFSGRSHAEDSVDSVALPAVAHELNRMQIEDQRYRGENDTIFKTTPWTDSLEHWVWSRQSEIDSTNVKRLEELIDQYGWLGMHKVGNDGAEAVFLIIQHAGLAVQEKYLPKMRESVAAGDFPPTCLAYLEDRIRISEGKPQLYGTQVKVDMETGKPELYPIEDEVNVDKRRAEVGLGPLADYCAEFGIVYVPVGDSIKE